MTDLTTSLTDLIAVCRSVGLPFVEFLRPGTDRATFLRITQSLDVELPEELLEFYEFCDGVDANGLMDHESGVYHGYSFVPLGQAIDEYRELQLEIITEGWDDISEAWFPLLRVDSEFYFVDCDKAQKDEPYILSYSFDSGPEMMYQSIRAMINTFTDWYREGAFTVQEGKVTSSSYHLKGQIALRHNPEMAYWQNAPQARQELQEFLKSL